MPGGARRPTPSGSCATPRGWCRDSRACASRRTSVVRCCAAIPSPPHGWSICAALRCLRGQRVLFNRHALASGDTATATLWLDVKRAYLELRPHLRRLYTPVPERRSRADRARSARVRCTARRAGSDRGRRSLDAGQRLRAGLDRRLAQRSRRARARGRRAHRAGPGGAAARARRPRSRPQPPGARRPTSPASAARASRSPARSCCARCGDTEWTGTNSNVVEAVVSGLRRKMGDRATALETVRGVGYRLGPRYPSLACFAAYARAIHSRPNPPGPAGDRSRSHRIARAGR